MVDGKGSRVEILTIWLASHSDLSVGTNQEEVANCHVLEVLSKRIHPERVGVDGVSQSEMTCNPFVEAQLSKDAE